MLLRENTAVRMLQVQLSNTRIRGPAFPVHGIKKSSSLVNKFTQWLKLWQQKEKAKAIKDNCSGPTTIDLALAPQFDEDSELATFSNMDSIKVALTRTAFEWIQSKSDLKTILNIMAGCSIQLSQDVSQRINWLAHPSTSGLRQHIHDYFNSLVDSTTSWDFWDGIDVHNGSSSLTPPNPPLNQLDNQVQPQKLGQTMTTAQEADNLLRQTTHRIQVLKITQAIWSLLQKPGVGTININTEEEPIWTMIPDIYQHTSELVKVFFLSSHLLFFS
jgi:hypothetical protein